MADPIWRSKIKQYLLDKHSILLVPSGEGYILTWGHSTGEPVTGREFDTPEDAKQFVDDKWTDANSMFHDKYGGHLRELFREILQED